MSLGMFHRLGCALEERWRAVDYDERLFSSLAINAIAEIGDELDGFDPVGTLEAIGRESSLPEQSDPESKFGDLALDAYSSPRCIVQVLWWLDGSTAIHQHGFSGAFRVLAGSSIHCTYRFEERRSINRRFRLGSLDMQQVELLSASAVRRIDSGPTFIHSLFHLDRPSVSLVVRTHGDPGTAPQWNYEPSGLAYDPFFQNVVSARKIEAVRILFAEDDDTADAVFAKMLAEADFQLTYQLLDVISSGIRSSPILQRLEGARLRDRYDRLIEVARAKHGADVDVLVANIDDARRRIEIVQLRRALTQVDDRFLLALLLSVHDPGSVVKLFADRYPDTDPVEGLLDRIEAFTKMPQLGLSGANVVGVASYGSDHRTVLGGVLRGDDADRTAEHLARNHGGSLDAGRALVGDVLAELSQSSLLSPLVPQLPGRS